MGAQMDIDEICRLHGASILRRSQAILGDRSEAEDATQEVFMTLMEKHQSFRAEADIATWIYRITTNLCLNRIRSNHRRKLRDESEQVVTWTNLSPRDPYERYEAKSILLRLMRSLDKLDQQILVFRFIDGMTQEEISKITGKARRTIGKRVRRLDQKFSDHASEVVYE